MRNTIGMAAARVLSEMYRERDVRKEPSPPAPSREPPLQGKNDVVGPRGSHEPGQGRDPAY